MINKRNYEEISDREMFFFLSHIPFVGPVTVAKIRERVSPLNRLFRIDKRNLRESLGISAAAASALLAALSSFDDILQGLFNLEKINVRFFSPAQQEFPEELREIYAPPTGLFCRGLFPGEEKKERKMREEGENRKGENERKEKRPAVAIVGSRSCTGYGREAVKYIVKELCRYDIAIISGMAEGIDALAHKTALDAGGETYALLGSGVDICYPKENFFLYERLIRGEQGGVLSELPMGTRPLKGFFPMRNRLIAGLSRMVIVIEARERSGSLITANHALEQGKDIFVLPGRINDPLSKGCNRLIASGAGIINSVDDILTALSILPKKSPESIGKNLNALANPEKKVYSCLDLRPKHLEDISEATGLDYSETMQALLNLEVHGLVHQSSAHYYERKETVSGME